MDLFATRQLEALLKKVERLNAVEGGPFFGTVIGEYLGLPGLRGFWPLSSYDQAYNTYDLSGQGRTLALNGAVSFSYVNNVLPYIVATGAGYLSRADEAGLDITGALTFGCWLQVISVAASSSFLTKYTSTQQSYLLAFYSVSGKFEIWVSGDGTNNIVVSSTAATPSINTWYFVVGRFTPSTELAIWVNNTKTVNTTGIPASLFNSTAGFLVGGVGGAASMNGRLALPFICNFALPDITINRLFKLTRIFAGI